VLGDRDAFKQVMLILLDNALRHSDGSIDVLAQQEDTQVEIRVQDQGPGMTAAQLARIFDRFYLGEDRPAAQGLGLGLPIARTSIFCRRPCALL
jgi:signal transduction histidine kinase